AVNPLQAGALLTMSAGTVTIGVRITDVGDAAACVPGLPNSDARLAMRSTHR
ncbi:MAG: hypothetical protein QOF46_1759, partial [Paraburkholderia sp.]|nr:hypothetical protein [Paraburkholderia sp.]